ncbi:MAG: tRNA (guanosine(37)-N1)-methyltransferase TrmD [Patescibacteria group bacterium]
MQFDIITIFPELFHDFAGQSLVARAIKKKIISIKAHQMRDWTTDNHKTVDGRPYGGGAGMVLMIEPIAKAVRQIAMSGKAISKKKKTRVILMSASGKQFKQADARRLMKYDQLVFICGRYEGVDERVSDAIADEEFSVGPYVLFGGEIPAMVIMEAVSRLIPGVVQKEASVQDESHSIEWVLQYPQYTRPEVFVYKSKIKNQKSKTLRVPKVLLSGDHAKIKEWRDKHRG